MSVVITRVELIDKLASWGCSDGVRALEEELGREMTDIEMKDMIFTILSYYDFNGDDNLAEAVEGYGLKKYFTETQLGKFEKIEI